MKLVVQKYGGSSVKDAERVMNVARRIVEAYDAGSNVVVAVSAQGDTTDDLIEKAKEINENASKREMDMLLSTGEQISIALLAMAIEKIGRPVISLTGWQAGFRTDSSYGNARISRIDVKRLRSELDKRRIVIVAGFQGINKNDDITTLVRGGSDTSAVALAAALGADISASYVREAFRAGFSVQNIGGKASYDEETAAAQPLRVRAGAGYRFAGCVSLLGEAAWMPVYGLSGAAGAEYD